MFRHQVLIAGAAVLGLAAFGSAVRADDDTVRVVRVHDDGSADVDVQHNDEPYGQPMIFAGAGGNKSVRDLDDVTSSDFQTGYNVNGGLGIQLTRGVALRGVYTYSRSQGEGGAFSPIAGNNFNRHYYGADLQFRAWNDSGFAPYIFAGGGAVTVSPDSSSVLLSPSGARFANDSFTKPAARAGIGFEYQIPHSGFGLYAEGAGWAYKWDRYGFNRTEFDTNFGGGLMYRFGY